MQDAKKGGKLPDSKNKPAGKPDAGHKGKVEVDTKHTSGSGTHKPKK